MTHWAERFKSAVFFNPWLKWLLLPLAAIAVIGTVMSQVTPLTTPQVALSASPLYAQGARAKPALMLALSVEFPTVGAQYLSPNGGSTDASYSGGTLYIGYFDSEGCYVYNDNPTEGAAATYARFDRTKDATNHTCGGDSFSGNFMNWASSSAIDILRYGLTGGDRVVDTASLTVLQRAVLPTTVGSFWNGSNFPDKQIDATTAASVMPTTMIGAYAGTIHIANCLNRIHFGNQATGSCASPGNNSVFGVSQPASGAGPVSVYSGSLPSGFGPSCAGENGTCSFTGVLQVAYGANNSWKFMSASNGTACSNGVFGDPIVGTAKACYTRPNPAGAWTPPSSPGALTTDNFFYTRVSVCATSTSGLLMDPRPDLCQRYPSGQYKPAGNLQKYSDRVRVSAFGYLNDQNNNPNQRYGGVLRAPMKYVGPTAYDNNFSLIAGTNPNQEWDSTTGVFVANPDNNTTVASGPAYNGPYLSGVTNYLNQFGRTGIFGQYKTYDPVSELFYESLRYLQGLPPTPAAYTPLAGQTTQALNDGYPVFTTWNDPNPAVSGLSDYSCVRNNIFVVGDIHTHNDASIPGNTTLSGNDFKVNPDVVGSGPYPNNLPDFNFWMRVVGGFEAANSPGVTYLDGQGGTQTTNSPANPNPITSLQNLQNQTPVTSGDGATYYIAGVAYWANTHDIRGTDWTAQPSLQRKGMRVTTYVLDVNEYGDSSNPSNHAKTQFFLAAKYGGFTDASATGNPFKNKDGSVNNNDWQSPSSPGEANTYYLSSSAQAVLNGLNNIFASVAAQAGSIAGGAISTQQLTNAVPGVIYQAKFNPAGWSGDLAAYPVTTSASGVVGVGTTPAWQASVELDAKSGATVPGGSNRQIVIGNSNAATATASDFNWGTSLPNDVQVALQTPPYAPTGAAQDPASTGQARLNYLRGDRANESPNGLLFRARTTVLGDIVNSAVVFSGAPSQDISDASYATFLASYANRKHALFVGANDGMLHAFDPDHGTVTGHTGGNELFGYIPSWLIPSLGALTSTSYVHQSYVDATPAVSEAKVGTTWASGSWKTVLVGGTGGGGPGVYALDVSDPAAFNASKVLWEFTVKDDAELGQVVGTPQILKFHTSASGSPDDYQYFAVVASGVNNYANTAFKPGTDSPATMFLLDLSKPVGTAWKLGSNYFKIEFGAAATTTANGLVNFNATVGDNGAVKAIYAGDLQGNLWKVDFTLAKNGKADWNLGTLSYYQNSNGPVPMFIAKSSTGVRQPITMQPTLAFGANHTIIVSFGTGKFLEPSDNTITGSPQQSVYALLDNGQNTLDSGVGSSAAIAGRGRLQPGAVNAANGTITVTAFNWGRPLTDADMTQRSGWYADFAANSGERQISNFSLVQGSLFFGSLIPSVNSCAAGSGNYYSVQLASGNGSFSQSNVGILGQPFVTQVGSWTQSTADTTGKIWETGTLQIILQGSSGLSAAPPQVQAARYTGRLSWRQISNYQQLRHLP